MTSTKHLRLILYFSENEENNFGTYFLVSEAVARRRPAEKAILKIFFFGFCAVSQNPSGLSKHEKRKSATL